MGTLKDVVSGKTNLPRRVTLYGPGGIGKSSWAARSPKPVFIQTEDGLGHLDVAKFPLAGSYADVLEAIGSLYSDNHKYKTVVLDSLDQLERLIWGRVCQDRKVASVDDIGYGKGYGFAMSYWNETLEGLQALRDTKNMTIILIAHAQIVKFDNPETESYDRYCPRLHKNASALVAEWCDEILFATYKVHTTQDEKGFGQKKVRGIGTGERIIRTTERPAHVAKNRLSLPDEIPLSWNEYAKHFQNGKGETNG